MTDFDKIRADVLRLLAAGPRVDFEERGHVYILGGEQLPSVSRLAGGGDGYNIAERRMPEVLDRGRAVARLIAELEENGRVRRVVNGLRGFLESWIRFKDWCGWRTIAAERPLVGRLTRCQLCGAPANCLHPRDVFDFAGMLDVFGMMTRPPEWLPGDALYVLENKTSGGLNGGAGTSGLGRHATVQAAGYMWQVGCHVGARYAVGALALRLDGAGVIDFERKRRKNDDELVPIFWGGRQDYLGRFAESPAVPMRGTIRPASVTDLSDFLTSCWHEFDQREQRPALAFQGGDAEEDTGLQPGRPDLHLWSPAGPPASREAPAS
jgi:hypothetical protein